MSKLIDLTGKTFSYLTVKGIADRNGPRRTIRWRCQCVCGNHVNVVGCHLRSGHTQSCGCLHEWLMQSGNLVRKHGAIKRVNGKRVPQPEYVNWQHMKNRCYNPNSKDYYLYGGRGITVCAKWLNSFEAFYADMGPRPTKQHSIDRYPDKNGNYEPTNCRWATALEQSYNTRRRTFTINKNGKFVGAYYHPSTGKWEARIHKHNQMIYLGQYNTAQEAHQAYCDAADLIDCDD